MATTTTPTPWHPIDDALLPLADALDGLRTIIDPEHLHTHLQAHGTRPSHRLAAVYAGPRDRNGTIGRRKKLRLVLVQCMSDGIAAETDAGLQRVFDALRQWENAAFVAMTRREAATAGHLEKYGIINPRERFGDDVIDAGDDVIDAAKAEAEQLRFVVRMIEAKIEKSRQAPTTATSQADLWITGKAAALIAGITAANVGRNAGPQGSGKAILDNGKTGAARRYYKPSVADFRAARDAAGVAETETPSSIRAARRLLDNCE